MLGTFDLRFMPGEDDVDGFLGDEDGTGEKKRSKRRKKMEEFAKSPLMHESLLLCAISSIPRWHLARSIDARQKPGEEATLGVGIALKKCLLDCQRIIDSIDDFAEYWLSVALDSGRLRLLVWRALCRTLLYLSLRNLPFCRGIWRILRGVDKPSEVRRLVESMGCCHDSGLDAVVAKYMSKLPKREKVVSYGLLTRRLDRMCNVYTAKGYPSNRDAESELRHCSALALRRPFKPVTFRTLVRENAIRFLTITKKKMASGCYKKRIREQ